MHLTRREFVAAGAAAGIAAAVPAHAVRAMTRRASDGIVLLFQGDSITDCGRDRTSKVSNDPKGLGTGYPLLIAADLPGRFPDREYQVFNRGVSGNKVVDLRERWQVDTVVLKPDVLSILIGVNDLWHTLMGRYDGTVEKYEAGYTALLANTRDALPKTKLVVMEPFTLLVGAVTDAWFPEFDRYRAAAQRVARAAGATFVPLHDMLQDLAKQSSPLRWTADGVHPTIAGHGAIARRWLETVKL